MTDQFLTGIYADSTPGGGSALTEKCGNLRASTGVSASTVYASPVGTIPSDSLGDQAIIEPGTHPTLNRGNTLAARQARNVQLGFTVDGTTYFDGSTMMFALPHRSSDSGNFSLSYWASPGPEGSGGPAKGCILASPLNVYYTPPSDLGSGTETTAYLWVGMGVGDGVEQVTSPNPTPSGSVHYSDTRFGQTDPMGGNADNVTSTIWGESGHGGGSTWFTPAYDAGTTGKYFHYMIATKVVSNNSIHVTIYVNDTPILNDVVVATPGFFTAAMPIGYSKLADGSNTVLQHGIFDDASDGLNRNQWAIGGRMNDPVYFDNIGPTPFDDGINCAVTELWVAEGQYVDWTDAAVRAKFHTTDILGEVFVPVNLGTRGQRPTGTAPTMYYTGKPTNFRTNRVTGSNASVYGGLLLDTRAPGG